MHQADYKFIKKLFRDLSAAQKAEIIESELQGAGLNVTFSDGNSTTTEICTRICNAEDLEVDQVMEAIAFRVRRDRENFPWRDNPQP